MWHGLTHASAIRSLETTLADVGDERKSSLTNQVRQMSRPRLSPRVSDGETTAPTRNGWSGLCLACGGRCEGLTSAQGGAILELLVISGGANMELKDFVAETLKRVSDNSQSLFPDKNS